jgi:hypothetical protein
VINFSEISNSSLLGRALRLPLRLIPGGAVVPVAQGPLRGGLLRRLQLLGCAFRIDGLKMLRWIADVPWFVRTALQYRARCQEADGFRLSLLDFCPCPGDWRETAGNLAGHDFWQDLWAARKTSQARPAYHVGAGSSIDVFIAHLVCFMPVTVF